MPVLTTAWHIAHPILTAIGALFVGTSAWLAWELRRARKRAEARQRQFEADLEALLKAGTGGAR